MWLLSVALVLGATLLLVLGLLSDDGLTLVVLSIASSVAAALALAARWRRPSPSEQDRPSDAVIDR